MNLIPDHHKHHKETTLDNCHCSLSPWDPKTFPGPQLPGSFPSISWRRAVDKGEPGHHRASFSLELPSLLDLISTTQCRQWLHTHTAASLYQVYLGTVAPCLANSIPPAWTILPSPLQLISDAITPPFQWPSSVISHFLGLLRHLLFKTLNWKGYTISHRLTFHTCIVGMVVKMSLRKSSWPWPVWLS